MTSRGPLEPTCRRKTSRTRSGDRYDRPRAGKKLTIVKYVAYGWSGVRTMEALRDQTDAALVTAREIGWDGLAGEQTAFLDDFWKAPTWSSTATKRFNSGALLALSCSPVGVRKRTARNSRERSDSSGYDGHAFWTASLCPARPQPDRP